MEQVNDLEARRIRPPVHTSNSAQAIELLFLFQESAHLQDAVRLDEKRPLLAPIFILRQFASADSVREALRDGGGNRIRIQTLWKHLFDG
jgi:hypothetical protein